VTVDLSATLTAPLGSSALPSSSTMLRRPMVGSACVSRVRVWVRAGHSTRVHHRERERGWIVGLVCWTCQSDTLKSSSCWTFSWSTVYFFNNLLDCDTVSASALADAKFWPKKIVFENSGWEGRDVRCCNPFSYGGLPLWRESWKVMKKQHYTRVAKWNIFIQKNNLGKFWRNSEWKILV
jgi:hypothetical protein